MHNVWPCAIVVLSLTGTCMPSVCADLSLDDSEVKTVTIMSSKWGQTIGEFEREVVIDSDRLVDLGEYGVISVLNLPARIDENSVRVKDIIGAEVLGTSFSTTVVSRKDDPSFQEAERAVQKQLNDLTVTLASHQLELNRLQSIPGILDNYLRNLATPVQSSGEVLPSSVSVSGLVDAIDGLGALTKQNIKEQSTVSRIIDETKECITATKARLQQLQNNGRLVPCTCSCSTSQGTAENGDTDAEADDTSAEARVQQWPSQISFKNLQLHVRFGDTVASQPRSKVKFLITYQCSGVSWSPEYDVKLNEESIDVYGFASVVQYTGEDWSDTELLLSTASPSFQLDPPAVHSKVVQFRDAEHRAFNRGFSAMASGAPRMKMKMGASMMVEEADDMGDGIEAAAGMAADYQEYQTQRSAVVNADGSMGQSYTFQVAHPVNISASAKPGHVSTSAYRVLLNHVRLEPQLFSYSAPGTKPTAYTTAVGKYSIDDKSTGESSSTADTLAPILQARSRMFVDNTFVGTTSTHETMPGEPFRFNLGEDKNIRVTYTHVLDKSGNEEEDKSTFFVTDKQTFHVKTHEARFTAASTHKKASLVILEETVPVPSHEDIRLQVLVPEKAEIITATEGDVGLKGLNAVYQPTTGSLSEQLLGTVVAKMHAAGVRGGTDGTSSLHVFKSESSGSYFFAQWLGPGQKLSTGVKYKLMWPTDKKIATQW